MNEEERYSERCQALAELLVENIGYLHAIIGIKPEDITPEKLQDGAILAIKRVINNIDHIHIHELKEDDKNVENN